MTEVEQYINTKILQIMDSNTYKAAWKVNFDKEKSMFVYTIPNFQWVGVNSFLDIIRRVLRHNLGKYAEEYLEVSGERGEPGRHSYDFELCIKIKVDLETLAGYLRIMESKS